MFEGMVFYKHTYLVFLEGIAISLNDFAVCSADL